MNIDQYISGLTATTDNQPHLLLQYLIDIQYQYSCVPPEAIKLLSEKLSLTQSDIQGVVSFYSFLHDTPRGRFDILFSDNITDQMLGCRPLIDRLCRQLGVVPGGPRDDGRVTVDTTSCTGMCDQGPAMLVNGRAITRLDQERIDTITGLVESDTDLSQWPAEFFQVDDNIRCRNILLTDDVEEGAALESFISHGAEAILQQIELSDLRGRGGAGFKTGTKWRFCKQADADQHYVICNADEGEPGTFKDRVLLNSFADRVFAGMTVCAGIIGARQGFLYLRGEYRYLRKKLENILEQRRKAGLLGNNILGQENFNFDIEIHMGAGAYICGEESSLIESLEGKRGIPRNRPPFPVTNGFLDMPSVVNNVETFMAATQIAIHGADWFQCCGTEISQGTKLLSISGDCERPGIYEYPFGVSVQQVLDDCGARDALAVQLSGAAGTTIHASEFQRLIAFEDLATGGSFMILNRQRNLLDMVKNFSEFFVHESCGFCTPCRVGTSLLRDLVAKVHDGHASQYDLEEMRRIATVMKTASHCGLGMTASNSVVETLDKFPHIYHQRLKHSRYEPAFDLDAALQEARDITERDDAGAHIVSDT
jgi:[NiFe] hydrogenase diaphorase moiety large subunit